MGSPTSRQQARDAAMPCWTTSTWNHTLRSFLEVRVLVDYTPRLEQLGFVNTVACIPGKPRRHLGDLHITAPHAAASARAHRRRRSWPPTTIATTTTAPTPGKHGRRPRTIAPTRTKCRTSRITCTRPRPGRRIRPPPTPPRWPPRPDTWVHCLISSSNST